MQNKAQICPECKKPAKRITKGVCHNCYRKSHWVKPKIVCVRCGKEKNHHSHGYCGGCYNSVFHIEGIKRHNQRKMHELDPDMYKFITQKCAICGFGLAVELHHLDGNRKNFSVKNLVGLCPNHHSMAEDRRWKFGIYDQLQAKGYTIPDTPKLRFDRKLFEYGGDVDSFLKSLESVKTQSNL